MEAWEDQHRDWRNQRLNGESQRQNRETQREGSKGERGEQRIGKESDPESRGQEEKVERLESYGGEG